MKVDWSNLPLWTNEVYKPLYKDRNRYNIIYGSAGSGKSVAEVHRKIFRLTTEPGHNWLIARGYEVTNRKSTFPLVRKVINQWGLQDFYRTNVSNMVIKNIFNKNEIRFEGLDDVEKLKSATFENGDLTDVWVEEATEAQQGDFEELDRRMRGISKYPKQITLTFNPINILHWIKTDLIDPNIGNPDYTFLRTTWRENDFLDDADRRKYSSMKGLAKTVYDLGEWGLVEGLIFPDFKVSRIPESAKLIGYGLDWGFTNDPTVLVAVWKLGKSIWMDEIFYRYGMTNEEIVSQLAKNKISKYVEIIADRQEMKSIDFLFRHGYNAHECTKGPDSVRYTIDEMKGYELNLTPESTNGIKEFSSYCWKKNRIGKMIGEPVDSFNHFIDAARYRITHKSKFITAGTAM